MINLAHNLGSPQDLITYTQIYVQQSRNSEDNSSVVYCQKAPANVELQGLYQCQFNSSSRTTFTGGLKLGGKGTMPFGFTSPLDPAGGWYALEEFSVIFRSTDIQLLQPRSPWRTYCRWRSTH